MDDPFALEVNVGSMNGNESCRETQNQDLPQQDARDFFPTSKHRASLGNRDKNVWAPNKSAEWHPVLVSRHDLEQADVT